MSGSPWGNEKITVEQVPDESMNHSSSPWGNEKITKERVLDDNPNVHLQNAETALRNKEYDEARKHIGYARSVSNGNPEVERQCKVVLDALDNKKCKNEEWERGETESQHIDSDIELLIKAQNALAGRSYSFAELYASQAVEKSHDVKIMKDAQEIFKELKRIYKKKIEEYRNNPCLVGGHLYVHQLENIERKSKVAWRQTYYLKKIKTALEEKQYVKADNLANSAISFWPEIQNRIKKIREDVIKQEERQCSEQEERQCSEQEERQYRQKKEKQKREEAHIILEKFKSALEKTDYEEADNLANQVLSLCPDTMVQSRIKKIREDFQNADLLLKTVKYDIANENYVNVEKDLKSVLQKGNRIAKQEALKLFGTLKKAKEESAKKSLMEALKAIESGKYEEAQNCIQKAESFTQSQKIKLTVDKARTLLENNKKLDSLLKQANQDIFINRNYIEAEKIIDFLKQKGNKRLKDGAAELSEKMETEKKLDKLMGRAVDKLSRNEFDEVEKYIYMMQSISKSDSRCSKLRIEMENNPVWHMGKAVSLFKRLELDEAAGHVKEAWNKSDRAVVFLQCLLKSLNYQSGGIENTGSFLTREKGFNLTGVSDDVIQNLEGISSQLIDNSLKVINYDDSDKKGKISAFMAHLFVMLICILFSVIGFSSTSFPRQLFGWFFLMLTGIEGISFYCNKKICGYRWKNKVLFCYSRGFGAIFFLWLAIHLCITGKIMFLVLGIFAFVLSLGEVVLLLNYIRKQR